MRKKKIECKCEAIPETNNEYYFLKIKTHDQTIEAKIDKENARHIIETIDNEIL